MGDSQPSRERSDAPTASYRGTTTNPSKGDQKAHKRTTSAKRHETTQSILAISEYLANPKGEAPKQHLQVLADAIQDQEAQIQEIEARNRLIEQLLAGSLKTIERNTSNLANG